MQRTVPDERWSAFTRDDLIAAAADIENDIEDDSSDDSLPSLRTIMGLHRPKAVDLDIPSDRISSRDSDTGRGSEGDTSLDGFIMPDDEGEPCIIPPLLVEAVATPLGRGYGRSHRQKATYIAEDVRPRRLKRYRVCT